MSKPNETRITVRFPSQVITDLKGTIEAYGPSLNSEIVQAVREYTARKKQKGEKLREKSV